MPTFDVILITDTPYRDKWIRGYGAHRIASHLRKQGISCLVVDFSSYLNFQTWKSICDRAIGKNTKFIGFSTTWWPYRTPKGEPFFGLDTIGSSESIRSLQDSLTYAAGNGKLSDWIAYAKELNSKIKIVIGGPKAHFYFDIPADHFIVGYGETQFEDLITQSRRIWPKIIEHDTEAKNPIWDFKFSSTEYTAFDQLQPYESLMFEFSRGCRFKCSFCNYPLIGRKDISSYVKDHDTIYSELLENYERYGITNYTVADDTLNDSTEKLEHIVRAVNKLPFQPKFQAYTRLDVIVTHPTQISLLKEMGLTRTWIGIDSLHPIASKAIGKGMSEQRKKDMLWKLKDSWGTDVTIDAGYIVGLPGETAEFTESFFEWADHKDSPIFAVEFIALLLAPEVPALKYQRRSDMDINYQKYGYEIPNLEKFWEWTKDDNIGINSYSRANALAQKLNSKRTNRTYSENFIEDKMVQREPDWYFENLIKKLD